MLSVVSVADRTGFHTLASALRESDHISVLEGTGPFTLFAPTDAAFKRFSPSVLARVMKDRELLHQVLGYHFAAGRVAMARFEGKRIRAVMRAGGDVIIDGKAGVRVNAARVVKPDLNAGNGVVHGIDGVLLPRELAAAMGAA
ncbi:MAG: fasciclin domain-containing protein [Hyphomonadaceae bacterium]